MRFCGCLFGPTAQLAGTGVCAQFGGAKSARTERSLPTLKWFASQVDVQLETDESDCGIDGR